MRGKHTAYLIVLSSVFRCIIAATTGLGTGEAYYTRGLKNLQLSYFDQPPLFFWISKASTLILGVNNIGVRFPSILFFAATCWLLYKITVKIYNERAAFFAVLVLNLSFVFTVPIATWFQPDAALIFFWMWALYISYRLFFEADKSQKNAPLLWVLLGFAGGLGLLSKYHTALLLLAIAIFTFSSKTYRKHLLTPWPYVAVIIIVSCSFPLFYWNAQHEWISFLWQGSRSIGKESTLHIDWFLRSIGGQALWLAPWIWIMIIVATIKEVKLLDSKRSFFLLTTALPVIIIFTCISLWSDTQFHFHWQAPGYITLMIMVGGYIDRNQEKKAIRRWLRFSTVALVVVIPILLIHSAYGILNNPIIRDKNGVDPTIDGKDFEEIRTRFEKEGWLDSNTIFVVSTKWHQAGKIDWALTLQKEVVVISGDIRNYAYLIDPNKWLGKNAILVTLQDDPSTLDWCIYPFFDSVKELEPIYIERGGIKEMRFGVLYCKNFKIPQKERMHFPVYRQLIGLEPYGSTEK